MYELVVNLISAFRRLTKHTQETSPNTSSRIVFPHTLDMLMQNHFPQAGFNRKEMEVLDLLKPNATRKGSDTH